MPFMWNVPIVKSLVFPEFPGVVYQTVAVQTSTKKISGLIFWKIIVRNSKKRKDMALDNSWYQPSTTASIL